MQQQVYLKILTAFVFLSLALATNCLAQEETARKDIEPGATITTESDSQDKNTGLLDQRDSFLAGWLHMMDSSPNSTLEVGQTESVVSYASKFPGDIAKVLKESGGDKGLWGLVLLLILSLVSITSGYFAMFGARKLLQKHIPRLHTINNLNDNLSSKISLSLFQIIPKVVELLIIGVVSTVFFFLTCSLISVDNKMIYQLLLGGLLAVKFTTLITQIVFSTENAGKSLISLKVPLIKPVKRIVGSTVSIVLVCLLILNYFRELGVQAQTMSWLFIVSGTALMTSISYQLLCMREQVTIAIKAEAEPDAVKTQLADYWLFSTLFYLLACWVIWVGQEFTGTALHNGAFLASILILPAYLGISRLGKGVISSVLNSLNLFVTNEPEKWEQSSQMSSDQRKQQQSPQDKNAELASKVHTFFNIFIVFMLTAWLLNLWGYSVPFAQHAMKAIFQSIIVLTLALFCWQYASTYIEKKMEDAIPKDGGNAEDSDDEFGGATPRGRSYTLLPMLRKVIASLLIVMVMLIVVSSFGVNIGPLLAGAGVLGLAIGFGAQKLVSDVLSGFFFLFDDAFRVGEYIQAGSTKGTVEAITLRNVLLRHHLGMLQVVPHSDLGAVTNFMRGGIVIKFPLEFPYDTDIDKVRKVIKKVGQAMLDEPEFGDDFILPVKSQGVNEIANSVMVIRVKFTSKPGKQFVIKREAFRRITEALNAKGIYYAHRKVIVDFPTDTQPNNIDEQTEQKALQAGAAAAIGTTVKSQVETSEL